MQENMINYMLGVLLIATLAILEVSYACRTVILYIIKNAI